ncbi:hypothetical protein BJY00DRAFT_274023 [Aspergillus carlsbadensis]|nr:hypothetical protein BJY00DRAFT_274023 [Aspergillus carlsbadensis]
MFYAILSMAAGKLARKKPEMKVQALQYQSMALSNLYADVSNASGWTKELLFVVLNLGLSTSWHVITDLGIPHLKAMRGAMREKTVQKWCDSQTLRFFKDALIYWEMVVCSVNDEAPVQSYPRADIPLPHIGQETEDTGSSRMSRIMPHPFTGAASAPQALFGRLAHHIRQVRPYNTGCTLSCPESFLESLDTLEEEVWQLELPMLHEVANTGDQSTPAIHHLLLVEAYMFANLYQLYYAFPNRCQKRAKMIKERLQNGSFRQSCSWAEQQAWSWSSLLLQGTPKQWVEFLGRNTIMRLEQIPITSGTTCIHPLLLLVGSGSLFVTTELEETGEASEILRTRDFVLDRMTQLSGLKLSEPICQIKLVVVEIFKRLDLGIDVFWMDILHSMGVITIIG